MFIKLFVYTLMLRTCHILHVHTSILFYYNIRASVCIYAIVIAVIIKIFGSQVKSSRLNYSIEYCVATHGGIYCTLNAYI